VDRGVVQAHITWPHYTSVHLPPLLHMTIDQNEREAEEEERVYHRCVRGDLKGGRHRCRGG